MLCATELLSLGFILAYISGSQVRKKIAWEVNTTARPMGKGAVERDD